MGESKMNEEDTIRVKDLLEDLEGSAKKTVEYIEEITELLNKQ